MQFLPMWPKSRGMIPELLLMYSENSIMIAINIFHNIDKKQTSPKTILSQRAHKRLVNVFIMFTIAFRIGSECPFIERVVLGKTFS